MKYSFYLFLVTISFAACQKNTAVTTIPVTSATVKDLVADTIIGTSLQGQPYGANKFTFYSLESNKIIASTDSASTKWDLAFKGTTILTNGGTSGPGKGGAFVYIGLYDGVTAVHADSTFKTDNAPTYAITTGSNKGWYVYDGMNNLINPIPGRVLMIRTANGNYAKVEILNYYKGGVTPSATASDAIKSSEQRYYTFRFTYQPNGSKTF